MVKSRLFIFLQYCLPQHFVSRLFAKLATSQQAWLKNYLINWFIKRYAIDMQLAAQTDLVHYPSFNDFFIRQLKNGVRPIAEQGVVSPADGAISQIGDIINDTIIQAKGQDYTVMQLLGDKALALLFSNGKFATIYLAPKDYHRVHMPITGKLIKTIYIPGKLFSVNAVTAANVPQLFARNERLICLFDTAIGTAAVILVGAMFVAGISTVWGGDIKPSKLPQVENFTQRSITLQKGEELGHFKFGSTVILLLPKQTIEWLPTLMAGSVLTMGQQLTVHC